MSHMPRDFHLPGRSPVYAREGMAATSHPLASLAAIEVLRAGGNAADAAVTAVALLSVIEPHMTGIGGDCFCLIAKPGAPVWGYNGSGRTGAAMTYRRAARARPHRFDPAGFDPCHHGAGRGRCLGSDPENRMAVLDLIAPWRRRSQRPKRAMRLLPRIAFDWALQARAPAQGQGRDVALSARRKAAGCGRHHQVAGARRDTEDASRKTDRAHFTTPTSRKTSSTPSRRAATRWRRRISPPIAARKRFRSRRIIAASISWKCRRTGRAWRRSCS